MKPDVERMVDSPDPDCPEKGGTTQRQDLMSIFWAGQQRSPSYLLKEDQEGFKSQMKIWRGQARKGVINIQSANCQEHAYKGRKYYGFTLQQHNPHTGEMEHLDDPLSLMMFGFMVSGLTYWMTSRENRDRIVAYVMKGIDEERFSTQ
tara:strand:+ start:96 stop:539 length:444 start_codon:yes stop_codon:yes gene_type:complete